MPIRGGLEASGAAFRGPDRFSARNIRDDPSRTYTILVQALVGGRCSIRCPWPWKKGEVGRIAHAYIIPLTTTRDRQNLAPWIAIGTHRHKRHYGERSVAYFIDEGRGAR